MDKQEKRSFDIIVVGAGSGGLTVAISLANAGKKVLLVEQDKIGGECTHSGCIPSKAFIHYAQKNHSQINSSSSEALSFSRDLIDHVYREETPEEIKKYGTNVVHGSGIFTGPNNLKVGEIEYSFKKAVIATGSLPRTINIPGLNPKKVLTNQNFFLQETLPEKLLVLGAGPIGMELSQASALLGSSVTLVSNKDRLANTETPQISDLIQKKFSHDNVSVLYNSSISSIEGENIARIEKTHGHASEALSIPFDKVLLAIGRVPNLPEGLQEAGVKYNAHGITINKKYLTSNKNIYAIGDVSQKEKFTHAANDAGRSVVKHILSQGFLSGLVPTNLPKVTFTIPEIAQVGMSYKQAVEKYGVQEVFEVTTDYNQNDRAKTDRATETGLAIVVTKKLSGRVLGATIIGKSAGELISYYTLAMNQNISLWKISKTIFPYPTLSQIVKKTGDEFVIQTMRNFKNDLCYLLKKHSSKALALIIWGVLIYLFHKQTTDISLQDSFVLLYDFVTSSAWGPFLFIFIYIIRPIIFFPATLLTALSGALFGLPLGIAYTIIGENISANFAYWIGRFFGNNTRMEDNKTFGIWIKKIRNDPFTSVILMRFLFFPFDLTNYMSGILKIQWKAYTLATFIGIIPGLVTFVVFGASLENIENMDLSEVSFDIPTLLLGVFLFISSLLLAKYIKKKKLA